MVRSIVVTGVTRGLGRAACEEFIRAGHRVAGCGRDDESLRDLQGRYGEHSFHRVDVSDDESVGRWTSELADVGFCPDLVLNNAALCHEPQAVWDMTAVEFDRVTQVNLCGAANVMRHWIPPMIQAGVGVMVNFSSGWGRSVSAGMGAYCMTKWGIEGLTQALAEDLPRGLAAVALNPGIIHTAMLSQCFGESASSYEEPAAWAKRAVPHLLGLTARDNGASLSTP